MKDSTRKAKIAKTRVEYAAIKKHLIAKAAEIETLIADCSHKDHSSQADPSGGNDRAYTCNTCGKEW